MTVIKQSSKTYAVAVTALAAGSYDVSYNGEDK
jgi:hypothetical protein